MMTKFKDAPLGMFRGRSGLVYTKINQTQAVIITSGKIIEYDLEETVYVCIST